jgi:hypothetical protein
VSDRYSPRTVSSIALSTNVDNVIAFPGANKPAKPFDTLTARLILEQHRRGELEEGVLLALLQAATGLRP